MNVPSRASNISRRPTSGSPIPSASLSASFACREPIDARKDAEHAALGAARGQLGRGRLREEAAVAGALVRLEDRHLALEAEDRAVHDGDAVPDRCIVQEIARREVVGAVDDHVPALAEDPVDVLRREALLEDLDGDVRVQRLDRPLGRVGLRLAETVGRVDDLALKVRLVDRVVVDDPERADAGGCEVERGRRAEPARADQEDARLEKLELPLLADLGDQEMAAVAAALRSRRASPGPRTGWPFRFQSVKPPARETTFS